MSLIAFVGNQNSGKSTLFNRLFHQNAHTGNYPGVTIDVKEIEENGNTYIDLPGIYSLTPFSGEEKITCSFLKEKPLDCILNIIDASSPIRGLHLTLQLKERNLPVFVVFNMVDRISKEERNYWEQILKQWDIPYCFVSAKTKENMETLKKKMLEIPRKGKILSYFDQEFQKCSPEQQIEKRYRYIDSFIKKKNIGDYHYDRIFLHPFFSYIIFFLLFGLIFYLTFGSLGPFLQDQLNSFMDFLGSKIQNALLQLHASESLVLFITDGIWKGVTSVFSFFPFVFFLFFFLSLLEDSGYLARMTFLIDRPMELMGLSGRCFMPLLLGFGCSVPAIMATKNLVEEKARRKTIQWIFFISCSAKIVVFSSIVPLFFTPAWFYIFLFYLFSIFLGILLIPRKNQKKEQELFIMEIPSYKMPLPMNTFRYIKTKMKDFLLKVFLWVFLSSVVFYLCKNIYLPFHPSVSLLQFLSEGLTFLFAPLGLNDWRIVSSLISGLTAKETILSSLEILIGLENIQDVFTFQSACSFLIFVLLYTPCLSTCSLVLKEIRPKRKAVFLLLKQFVIAWTVSFLFYQVIL